MIRGSLRLKLVAWNLALITASLGALAFILGFQNVRRLEADIDQELRDRSSRIAPTPPGQGMGNHRIRQGEAPHPPPMGGDLSPGQRRTDRFPPPPGISQGMAPEGGAPPPGRAIFDIRRPRIFNLLAEPETPGDVSFDPKGLMEGLAGREYFSTVDVNGERLRVFSRPRVMPNGGRSGVIQIARELRDVDLLRAGQVHTLSIIFPLALAAAGLAAFFLASRALQPIANLTRAAETISAEDLSRRLEVRGEDEFARLAETFNAMAGRLQASFSEIQRAYADLEAQYEMQRRFTADASHELRTPLTRLKLATSTALAGGPAEYRQALETADRAATAMASLVEQLLLLARTDASALATEEVEVDLRVVASDVALSLEGAGEDALLVELSEEPVRVLGDASLLARVLTNLVQNALRYRSGKPVHLSVEAQGDWAIATVRDFGEGIAAEHLPHLFERFYRVDAARSRREGGTGLGLAITKSLVEAHGGTIELASMPGHGTVVTIKLPIFIEERKTNNFLISAS